MINNYTILYSMVERRVVDLPSAVSRSPVTSHSSVRLLSGEGVDLWKEILTSIQRADFVVVTSCCIVSRSTRPSDEQYELSRAQLPSPRQSCKKRSILPLKRTILSVDVGDQIAREHDLAIEVRSRRPSFYSA